MAQTALGYAVANQRFQKLPRIPRPQKRETLEALTARAKTENLGSAEVARLTGASLRQLQWWDEQRCLMVRHKGHKRIYTPEDTAKVWTLVRLRRQGISLQRCRKLLSRHRVEKLQELVEAADVIRGFGLWIN